MRKVGHLLGIALCFTGRAILLALHCIGSVWNFVPARAQLWVEKISAGVSLVSNIAIVLAIVGVVVANTAHASREAAHASREKAAECMAVVSIGEASTLGDLGLAMVDTVILNRAKHIRTDDFDRALCLAAWGQHTNARTGRPMGNFSATEISALKSQFSSPAYRAALVRAKNIAFDVLGSSDPLLPPEYMYYHSFSRKDAAKAADWEKANGGLTCDLHVGMGSHHLTLCKKS